MSAARADRGAAARWARGLPAPVRRRAATGVLRSGGPQPAVVVSRAVLARSPAAAAALAAALRARPAARWRREDAQAARVRPGALAGGAVVWREGALVGRIAIGGLRPASARALARGGASAIRARLAAERRQTPWERITALRGARGPTTRQALEAFALIFGALPGVPRPAGRVAQPTDGTLALQWALARLRSMTPAQRRAVLRIVARLQGPPTTASGASAAGLDLDWKSNAALTSATKVQAAALGKKLGFPLGLEIFVGRSSAAPQVEDAMAITMAVAADRRPDAGVPVRCWITVYDDGALQTGTYLQEILAHEAFHCFQAQMVGDLAQSTKQSADGLTWVTEGGADWAACNVVPGPDPERALKLWAKTPTTQLMDRAYDGVGLFTLLTGRGIDLWARWPAIARAAVTSQAYDAAAGPEHEAVRRNWAPSLYQDLARGPDWDLDPKLPCVPDDAERGPVKNLFVEDGTSDYVRADAYAAQLYALRSDADVIHTVVQDGDMRLSSDDPKLDESNLHDRWFCTDLQADCSCPANSTRAGPPPPRIAADGGSIFAVTGGRGGVLGRVEGMTREDYCGVKLGLIVPGRSIGDLYLGQSRKSVLRTVPGLKPIESGFTTKNANGLLLGGGLIGITFQVRFGICSVPTLEAGGRAACSAQFPRSQPDRVAAVQTSNAGYATKGTGLGPGSDAAAVVGAFGEQYCEREEGNGPPEERPWSSCRVPAPGGGMTTWGFTVTKDGANIVLAVAVFDPRAIGD